MRDWGIGEWLGVGIWVFIIILGVANYEGSSGDTGGAIAWAEEYMMREISSTADPEFEDTDAVYDEDSDTWTVNGFVEVDGSGTHPFTVKLRYRGDEDHWKLISLNSW